MLEARVDIVRVASDHSVDAKEGNPGIAYQG